MKKPRHSPTAAEEREIARMLRERMQYRDKIIMRKFNVSRTVITRINHDVRRAVQLENAKVIHSSPACVESAGISGTIEG